MVGLRGEFSVGGRVKLPPEKQLAIIIVLLLIIPLGAKFIIQKITKSKSAGIVAFIIALGLIAFVYFFETVQ